MGWFWLALIPPFLYAVSNYIDKYLISKYFQETSLLVFSIFSGLVAAVALPFMYFFAWEGIQLLSWVHILILIIEGVIISCALIPYYYALDQEDASIVVPLFQTMPIFSLILAYFCLGEVISNQQFFAMIFIIVGSVGLTLKKTHGRWLPNTKVLSLMLLSAFMFSISSILFKYIAVQNDFLSSFTVAYTGALLVGLCFCLNKGLLKSFIVVFKKNKVSIIIFTLLNEFTDVFSGFIMTYVYTVLLVQISLVHVVSGFQAFFVLIIGIILTLLMPKIFKESIAREDILKKVVFILIIFAGGVLIHL